MQYATLPQPTERLGIREVRVAVREVERGHAVGITVTSRLNRLRCPVRLMPACGRFRGIENRSLRRRRSHHPDPARGGNGIPTEYRLSGVSDEDRGDLDLRLRDPGGEEVAKDTLLDAYPVLLFTPV